MLAVLIILAAIISSVFRALTPFAEKHKDSLEQRLSLFLGKPVHIDSMETGWYWFQPVVKLKNISIDAGESDEIAVKRLLVGINILGSLWNWQFVPGLLYIEDLNLKVFEQAGQWHIKGLPFVFSSQKSMNPESLSPILNWLLSQQKIVLKQVSIHVIRENGQVLPVHDINLSLVRNTGVFIMKGEALLYPVMESLRIQGEFSFNPFHFKSLSGHVFVSANQLQLSQWKYVLPDNRFQVQDGHADAQIWMDWQGGTLKTIQSRLGIDHFNVLDQKNSHSYSLPYLNLNAAWKSIQSGWEFSADQIHLKLEDDAWPENSVRLVYKKETDTWQLYISHLLLKSLENLPFVHEQFSNHALTHVRGDLKDSQIYFTAGQINYFLTVFSGLSWDSESDLRNVQNLKGVLHWQPDEGRLELDGEKPVFNVKGMPAFSPQILNASVNWKELSHGLRVNLEHFILSDTDLILSAEGTVDDVSSDSAGQINLNARLSLKNGQNWLKFIPSMYLKPKLDTWLKESIQKVDGLVAEMRINGEANDFPFDQSEGEFTIKGYIQGLNLIFAKDWPMVTDVDTYVHLNKRLLDFDLVQASLEDNLVNQGNVRITDLGLNHENLLIHTKVDTDSSKVIPYILKTPLIKKLKPLTLLQMSGTLNLDLQLEVPLYPENNDNLVLGNAVFTDNNLGIQHVLNELQFHGLGGALHFNQDGILDSQLNARLWEFPISLFLRSVHTAKPYVEVIMKGESTMADLGQTFKLPLSPWLQGSFALESVLTLTDDPGDLDHISLNTSLEGVLVDLPEPFFKPASAKAPLVVDIDFNPEKTLLLHLNYDNKLKSELWFSHQKKGFVFDKGDIHAGSGDLTWHVKKGLQLTGSLSRFDWEKWQPVLQKIRSISHQNEDDSFLIYLDMAFKSVTVGKEIYRDLFLKAWQQTKNTWKINFKQQGNEGHLIYSSKNNSLSGDFTSLHIQKTLGDSKNSEVLSVADMPNLDLHIKRLLWNDLEIGEIFLKAVRQSKSWQVEWFKIVSPSYQMIATGAWQNYGNGNNSHMQGTLQIKNLADALTQWKISPVVTARSGLVKFEVHWPGGFQNFSLKKLSGDLGMEFKHGEITHLSPETEEKLGLGKLLSILSLQTIPRRLTLDFSDLSNKGYSFDVFKGDFKISQGLMNTENSYIDGPIAYAGMNGDLDIGRQIYNLNLRVSPHVTASLPVVATIAGGPVAGLATWVISKMINKGMQKISGYTYKITGPWKQPLVQQVSIIHQKAA